MPKLLWSINVHDKVDHLKQQEELIRAEFGTDITIHVFCNGSHDARYREDILTTTGINSGHHNGVRDAHNSVLQYLPGHETVISSHADALFTDYGVVRKIVDMMDAADTSAAQLWSAVGLNPHTKRMQPYTYNDFFIMRADAWSKIGEITDDCDYAEGIEGVLGRKIIDTVGTDGLSIIPVGSTENVKSCKDGPCRFDDVLDDGVHLLIDHDIGKKMKFLRGYGQKSNAILMAARLI